MNAPVAWRIARRELRGGLRGVRIFLLCLALGVTAIAAVGTVRAAIEQGLRDEGAIILGGDAEMEFTYRYASEAERAWMDAQAEGVSEVVDFRSMAVVERGDETERGLTQVKAVDGLYPLLGAVALDPPLPLDTALAGEGGLPGAVCSATPGGVGATAVMVPPAWPNSSNASGRFSCWWAWQGSPWAGSESRPLCAPTWPGRPRPSPR